MVNQFEQQGTSVEELENIPDPLGDITDAQIQAELDGNPALLERLLAQRHEIE